MPADHSCGFHGIGVDRETASSLLFANLHDPEVEEFLARDLLAALQTGNRSSFPVQLRERPELWEMLDKVYDKQKALDHQRREAKAFIRDAGASSPVQATLSWETCYCPLRFQEILFYVQETQQEAVEFPALRNAMLVMLQHSLVSYQSPDESYLQVYKAESDEILARLRFPQYLEYVAAAKGEEAAEMLLLTLKYGRISKARLLKEAEAEMPPPELEKLLQQLVKERILRPDFDPRAEEARKRRRLEDSQDSKAETTEARPGKRLSG
eukprot:g17102.t1